MTSSGSPCGACKFLRRKCVIGCVFAPYFCHEQGATHFAAIHKVFGASNVSKLLSKLKESDRSEAAVTISYEAQARLQDPVYGCVSQIFELQEKVVNLQEQLASLKELAAQCFPSGHSIANLNRVHGKCLPHQQANSWFQSPNSGTMLQFEPNITNNLGDMDPSSVENVAYPYVPGENISSGSSEMTFSTMDTLEMQKYDGQLVFQEEIDDLSVAFRYCQHS